MITMVEVFKTNVRTKRQAKAVVNHIHKEIKNCSATFDLEDCDKILRVSYSDGGFNPNYLIKLCYDIGIFARILADEITIGEEEIKFSQYLEV